MLYRIFKFLFNLTVKGYFRSIYIKGLEHIPKSGPVIFAANHTSAFMDPILLGVYLPRTLFFLARGDVFKKKFVSFLLRNINMIPIYRKDESPDMIHKNEQIFEKCFDHLARGQTILIFPEGLSATERRLRPIKTGTARIALGAEKANDFNLDVKIIPIGINYSNPHYFRSDVFVNSGEPINVHDFVENYKVDERKAVLELTEKVKSELEKLTVIIEDDRLDKLIKQIEILYRSKLRDESIPSEKAPQDFYLSKEIVNAVEYHLEHNPNRVHDFELRISKYLNSLKRLKIRDTQVRSSKIKVNLFWRLIFFSFGFPLFLYGFITNYLPFKTADFVVKNVQIREDFVGSIKLAGGMFIFLFMYIFEALLLGNYVNGWWAIVFILSLYPAGLFTVNYLKQYYQTRGTFKYVALFMKRSDLIAQLKSTRQALVDELEKGRLEFLEIRDQKK